MNEPKISVIMTAYNSQNYIAQAIESIRKQTFKDWELIIINDASIDNTLEIIKKSQNIDKRIKIINLKKNSGPAIARNLGIRKSKGKYIAILDSDDLAHSKRLETQFKFLENNPQIYFIASSFNFIDKNGKFIAKRKYSLKQKITKKIVMKGLIQHSTLMFRKKAGLEYNQIYLQSEDRELLIRLLNQKKEGIIIPDILASYRNHPESLSILKIKEQKYFDKLPKQIKNNNFERESNDIKKEHFTKIRELSILFNNEKSICPYLKQLNKNIKNDGLLIWIPEIIRLPLRIIKKKIK